MSNVDVSPVKMVIEQKALRNVMDLDHKTKQKDKEKSSLNHFNCFLDNFRKEATDNAEKKDFKYFKSYKKIVFEDLENKRFLEIYVPIFLSMRARTANRKLHC